MFRNYFQIFTRISKKYFTNWKTSLGVNDTSYKQPVRQKRSTIISHLDHHLEHFLFKKEWVAFCVIEIQNLSFARCKSGFLVHFKLF